jgi:hypothetical protein
MSLPSAPRALPTVADLIRQLDQASDDLRQLRQSLCEAAEAEAQAAMRLKDEEAKLLDLGQVTGGNDMTRKANLRVQLAAHHHALAHAQEEHRRARMYYACMRIKYRVLQLKVRLLTSARRRA